MKKILHHFRISIMLGVLLFSSYSYQPHSVNTADYLRTLQVSQQSTTSPPAADNPSESNLDAPDQPATEFQFATDLIIKAVNPGYTLNSTRDVGELIELQKLTDNPRFSLAGYGLRYTNSSGNNALLLDFSEGSFMTGETLLMRLARSPDSDRADATYMTTIAMSAGQLELLHHDTVVDRICWGSGEDCAASFKSTQPTTLLRDLTTGDFAHVADYEPNFDPLHPSLELPPAPDHPSGGDTPDSTTEATAHCYDLEFSEILSYYANNKSEQFVELYNPSDKTVILNQCALRYKKKTYYLTGEIAADGYYAYYPTQQSAGPNLTKNPNSSNTLELVDANGTIVDSLVYNHGQKKSTSYARFYTNGGEVWDLTYAPTPGSANTYQEFRTCPSGKTINPDTGNCVNITGSSSKATSCPEGKYLNPLTGRCKKIADNSGTPKPCAEGYERNPETKRCRKIKSDNNGADYALVPNTYSDKSTFIAAGAVILVVSLGLVYIILQFRREIARTTRKVIQRLNHIRKNLVSRRVGFHRKQKP